MYYHQQITTRLAISKLWESAYINGVVELDYQQTPDGMFKARQTYIALTNYRRYVRCKRLNPLYKHEWMKISKCTIIVPKRPIVTIRLRAEFYHNRLLKNQLKKHPLNSLALPTSVVNL